MRLLQITLSILFFAYGLLPYNKARNVDTTKSNHIIVSQQQCGCPCPDVSVIKGEIEIPENILQKYPDLNQTQLNLDISNFNQSHNYELGQAKLYLTGRIVGVDTIMCNPTSCELAFRFKVHSWALAESVANVWAFPKYIFLIFLLNMILVLPTLIIWELVSRYKKFRRKKSNN